jgi:hypothetical protein
VGTAKFANHSISKIIFDPENFATRFAGPNLGQRYSTTLYASVVPTGRAAPDAMCGVWKSTDGGDSWQKQIIGTGDGVVTDLAYTIVTTAGGGQEFDLYAGIGNPRQNAGNANNGVWRSIDDGPWRRFTNTAIAQDNTGRVALATDTRPGAAPVVYIAFANQGQGARLLCVLRSGNNGAAWINIRPNQDEVTTFGTQANYDLSLELDPTNPQTVYLGGVRTFRSINSGVS